MLRYVIRNYVSIKSVKATPYLPRLKSFTLLPWGSPILLTVTVSSSILLEDKVDSNYLFITFSLRSIIIAVIFNYYILYCYLLYTLTVVFRLLIDIYKQ